MEELVASACILMPLKTVTQDNVVWGSVMNKKNKKPLISFLSDAPYILDLLN